MHLARDHSAIKVPYRRSATMATTAEVRDLQAKGD